jgi:hypothetical protein
MSVQEGVVALLVLIAALYSAWRLAPAQLRAWLRRLLGLRPPASKAGNCAECRERGH